MTIRSMSLYLSRRFTYTSYEIERHIIWLVITSENNISSVQHETEEIDDNLADCREKNI